MSYQFSVPAAARSDLGGDIDTVSAGYVAGISDTNTIDAVQDHLSAARDAALRLADVVGAPGDLLSVHVNGHANPGHGPREGFAPEVITVTVAVAAPAE